MPRRIRSITVKPLLSSADGNFETTVHKDEQVSYRRERPASTKENTKPIETEISKVTSSCESSAKQFLDASKWLSEHFRKASQVLRLFYASTLLAAAMVSFNSGWISRYLARALAFAAGWLWLQRKS
jgi:hypothetical protein